LGIDLKDFYNEVSEKVFENYPSLYSCFEEVVHNDKILKDLGFPEKTVKPLAEAIRQRIKETEVEIGGHLELVSYAPNGVDVIKETLKRAENVSKEDVKIRYSGSGKYNLKVKASDYKKAEKILKDTIDVAIDFIERNDGTGKFNREEK
jgi:translation initiation factor 2 subunit 1